MANSISAACKGSKLRDEMYTPRLLVEPLIPYINKWIFNFKQIHNREPIILVPFDTKDSEYVILFKENNYQIKYGHIDTGEDFFTHNYGEYDIVISNPPFSCKKRIYKKLFELDKPFALLGNIMQLNYMEIGSLFADNPIQLLIFDKRVSFDGKPSSFSSGYICKDFLEKDLIFEHLPHCNSGKNFIPSRMYIKNCGIKAYNLIVSADPLEMSYKNLANQLYIDNVEKMLLEYCTEELKKNTTKTTWIPKFNKPTELKFD